MIDLHIHSVYSDGTMTLAQIVADAVRRGATGIAVCDHNVIAGTLEAKPLAEAAGLVCLPGVEIDAMLMDKDAHILCYGADFSNETLLAHIRHARARLDWMSDELLRRMLPDFPRLDYGEYEALSHDPKQGGWKLLQYLKAKGITKSLDDALPYYFQYGVTYESADFRPAEEVVSAIHAAGGCAILAHPGVTFKDDALKAAEAALEIGIDGLECYYPRHSKRLEWLLLNWCDEHNLSATAGSDCHGSYARANICDTHTGADALRLRHPALKIFE